MNIGRGLLIAALAVMGWAGRQATADPGGAFDPPRATDGNVNLEGMWDSVNLTPLERPAQFNSPIMSEDDALAAEKRWISMRNDLSVPGDPTDANNLIVETIRGQRRSSVIVDPADGRIPGNEVFRQAVNKARKDVMNAFDHPEQRPGSERCIVSTAGGAPMLTIPANNFHQIVQTPSAIVLASESMHEARIIRINGTHIPHTVKSWTGDSVGRWEGNTLVVETRNFRDGITLGSPTFMFFLSASATVVERFTLEAHDRLNYVFTVEDPKYYTRAWTGETVFRRSDERMFEYACHEGNYALLFLLAGARAKELVETRPSTTSR